MMENSRSDNRIVDGGGNPRLCSARRSYENNELVRRGVEDCCQGIAPRPTESNARERPAEYWQRTRALKTEMIRTWTTRGKRAKENAEDASVRNGKIRKWKEGDTTKESEGQLSWRRTTVPENHVEREKIVENMDRKDKDRQHDNMMIENRKKACAEDESGKNDGEMDDNRR